MAEHHGKYVAYYRVSTQRQGRSGLGLEAQKKAVEDYLNGGAWELVGEFTEVETGKGSNALSKRPQLREALAYCKKHKATLLVAKLDRLARNVAFVSALMESGVEFTACDFPTANRLTVHILAAVAEHEREAISKRTREALAAAKARGKKLGNPRIADARAKINADRQEAADEFAQSLRPILHGLREQGMSQRAIADELNRLEIRTRQGKSWNLRQVQRILARIGL